MLSINGIQLPEKDVRFRFLVFSVRSMFRMNYINVKSSSDI